MDRRELCNVFTRFGVAALLVGSLGGVAACGSKPKQPTTVAEKEPDKKPEAKNDPLTATITSPDDNSPPAAEPILFDFDSYEIQEGSKGHLQKVAEYMNKNAKATVTISGHTDERGTTEYNLMLGDQRAKAAHDYLVRLGIDPVRIKTISFGEERPAVPGEGEENWSKNRRDEFNTTTNR
jgi:peptidoglycan-associated lipoprotein